MANLIRNGGFERGDITFWEALGNATLEASTDDQLYGVYAGKITALAGTYVGARSLDYIAVSEGDVVAVSAGYISVTTLGRDCWYVLELYDDDGIFIRGLESVDREVLGLWDEWRAQFIIPSGISYARVVWYMDNIVTGRVYYLDNVSVAIIETGKTLKLERELVSLTNHAASHDYPELSEYVLGMNEYYAEIDVTAVAGTTPTMTVYIKEYDTYGNERVLGQFTEVTAITDQRVGIAKPLGAVWVSTDVGGTTPTFTFEVSVIGVR